jgi:ABC-type Fe3+-hydroxamate transport system substrate-binding protein
MGAQTRARSLRQSVFFLRDVPKITFTGMQTFRDQMGRHIDLLQRPGKVISIVPSQSELLWDLGLKDELVGITKFCIHPAEMFRSVERMGGTKNLDIDKIRMMKPDLIIGNKEENDKEQIEILQKEFPVWMSDVYNFENAFEMISSIGAIFGKQMESTAIISQMRTQLKGVKGIIGGKKVAYFIWNDPYMLAAENTFIDHVLQYLGFENVASSLERYPELGHDELRELNPEICFLSSEPFPFKEKHKNGLQRILPESKILIVDGEMFSWYGTRMLKIPGYAMQLKKEIVR